MAGVMSDCVWAKESGNDACLSVSSLLGEDIWSGKRVTKVGAMGLREGELTGRERGRYLRGQDQSVLESPNVAQAAVSQPAKCLCSPPSGACAQTHKSTKYSAYRPNDIHPRNKHKYTNKLFRLKTSVGINALSPILFSQK